MLIYSGLALYNYTLTKLWSISIVLLLIWMLKILLWSVAGRLCAEVDLRILEISMGGVRIHLCSHLPLSSHLLFLACCGCLLSSLWSISHLHSFEGSSIQPALAIVNFQQLYHHLLFKMSVYQAICFFFFSVTPLKTF